MHPGEIQLQLRKGRSAKQRPQTKTDRRIVLDLRELALVDQGAVRFLEQCDANGIELQNCAPYIGEWIERQRDGK